MIASVQFKNFKALRAASLRLEPFNLVIGPNGSGKTSLIQALLHLRTLAQAATGIDLPAEAPAKPAAARRNGPEIIFRFTPPDAGIEAHLGCRSEQVCDLMELRHPDTAEARARAKTLREKLGRIRAYLLDHHAMAEPAAPAEGGELASNGRNLAAVLATLRAERPDVHARLEEEFRRVLPEFSNVELRPAGGGRVKLALRLAEGGETIDTENVSQGALYVLAILTLSFSPQPPPVVCIEETDRGIHPRLLRTVRDALYRLSHPESCGEKRAPAQIVATTHSPYLVDLFRDHPEDIVIASKRGQAATFERLSDRPDVKDILADGSLGDIWFSGILGGVPEE